MVMGQKRVLYVDDEENNLKVFYSLFKRDYEVSVASSAAKGMEILAEFPIEVIVTDQRMPQKTGVEFLEEVMQKYPEVIRIVLTGYAEMGDLIDAVNKGKIYHYLTKPWKREELKVVLDNAFESFDLKRKNRDLIEALREKNQSLEDANKEIKKLQGRLEAENTYLQSELRTEHDINSLIGSGAHFQRIIKLIDHVAPTSSTVLIQGETGTGKELIARAVHSKSGRSDRTLVKINCAALRGNAGPCGHDVRMHLIEDVVKTMCDPLICCWACACAAQCSTIQCWCVLMCIVGECCSS
ncbi:MAG: sigma-54-dependent Fis family transcriptional regulator [Bacteroidia bacterium]|nr:sigma-54-dependent Fis family transcriptional regulator [Bacteroidia bacterium]